MPSGKDARRRGRIWHLAGDEDKTVGLDRVAEGRDRLRSAADHVEFHWGFLVTARLSREGLSKGRLV